MMPAASFDRELGLRELLAGIPLDRLGKSLAALLGEDFRLVAPDGETMLGAAAQTMARQPLLFELEPVGYLECGPAGKERLGAAAALLELLLRSAARYRMASDLHLEAVQADYQALREKHAALQASEARYRELAEKLEQRVEEQVRTIESAQRQLYQAEKMASVGQLAAGVAHEINNPLGFIRSNLHTAQSYLARLDRLAAPAKAGDGPATAAAWREADMDFVLEDFAALLKESADGTDRVARIVADLKGFSSVDSVGEEAVSLNDNLRAVRNLAASQIGRRRVALELGDLPLFRCNAGRLNQVFLNLLLNAIQATGEEGEIRIGTRFDQGEIRVSVADNGSGIPTAALSRIFDPFFTTRDVGKGTGLGLTVSRDIVRAHGGRIEVESREGAGSTFTVILPAKPGKEPSADA